MAIPLVQSSDRNLNQAQHNIKTAVDPVLNNPLVNGSVIKSVTVVTGANTISTGLNRNLQGWVVVRCRSAATFYDKQDSNTTPTKTLLLVSSADAVIDIYVF